jgi:hypothetical protein
MNFRLVPLLTAWLAAACLGASPVRAVANELTEAEKAAGWRLLFDGQTTTGWRGFKKATFPARGWVVEDGCLKHVANGGGGDIVTDATFGDFELVWEWRLAAGANSGVKYFITETRGSAIGHEYQLLARANPETVDPPGKHVTAGFYDVLPTRIPIKLRPPGKFNESRILVRGGRVEHWLNGELTLAYEPGSPEVKAAVAASKFKDVPGFGEKLRGHILLQDHGGEAWFRNVKLREF